MPSFRTPEKQAERVIRRNLALGTPRHSNRDDGKIHSVRTSRNYRQALVQVARWMQANGHMQGLHRLDEALAQAYLEERARVVRQKTLDLDRQAIQTLPGIGKLTPVRSALKPTMLTTSGRAYTPLQVQMIASAQTPPHALATCIAHAAGLRAHELFTLRPANEQPASMHRVWSAYRFFGRPDQLRYSVAGKGGLVREVMIPQRLAVHLEARRLAAPQPVIDREVRYLKGYDMGGGHTWAKSFSSASQRILKWSTGAHGLRHSYAQERIDELQMHGVWYDDALEIVSQEMGHFRATITKVYLR
jgi:integrase